MRAGMSSHDRERLPQPNRTIHGHTWALTGALVAGLLLYRYALHTIAPAHAGLIWVLTLLAAGVTVWAFLLRPFRPVSPVENETPPPQGQ